MSNVQAELHLAQLTDEELSTMGRAIATGLDGNLNQTRLENRRSDLPLPRPNVA
ncbi:MAG: hypothetical protein WCI05_18045 [Myxococcales bacterium]